VIKGNLSSVFVYCDCKKREDYSERIPHLLHLSIEIDTGKNSQNEQNNTCKNCGKQWEAESKPIPGGWACYVFEKGDKND